MIKIELCEFSATALLKQNINAKCILKVNINIINI